MSTTEMAHRVSVSLAALLLAAAPLCTGCSDDRSGSRSQHRFASEPIEHPILCQLQCDWTPAGLIGLLSFRSVSLRCPPVLSQALLLDREAEEPTWPAFQVSHDGEAIPYRGKLAERDTWAAAKDRTLAFNERVNTRVNLSRLYDLSAPGLYQFTYYYRDRARTDPGNFDITSNTVEISGAALDSAGVRRGQDNKDAAAVNSASPMPRPVICSLKCRWASGNLVASLSFKNVRRKSIGIWKRDLLLEDEGRSFSWGAFEISRDGQAVPYSRMCVKRRPPTADEFKTLSFNEFVRSEVLVGGDDYDLSAPGAYRITYRGFVHALGEDDFFDICSNTIEVSKTR